MLLIFALITDLIYNTPKSYSFPLYAGQYTVHLYGGQGGHSYDGGILSRNGGKGAYVRGTMKITGTGTLFYAYVGGQGSWSSTQGPNSGGYNGGGSGGTDVSGGDGTTDASGGGGGATDLRIRSSSYTYRIIVAAGGSGAARTCNGAPGGELTGYYPTSNDNFEKSTLVTQTQGVYSGVGQGGLNYGWTPGSGAGGGYRGGVRASTSMNYYDSYLAVAHSGSSYISGYSGCTVNTNMNFSGGYMESGVNEGNGKIEIIYDFVCSSNCVDCISSSMCTKCQSGYIMYYNDTCQLTCPVGYIILNSRCFMCSTGCSSCSISTSHCNTCKEDYYYYDYYCYAECHILNTIYKDGNKYFGNDLENMTCQECIDENCLRCDRNYLICELCPVDYHLENGTCVHDPTELFTKSNLFSESSLFSPSSNFSYSQMFSESNKFSGSRKFSLSDVFSLTTVFTVSHDFSDSVVFTKSDDLTKSNYFTHSIRFSESIKFSESFEFSYSSNFSDSQVFSISLIFSNSNEFSHSEYFSNSIQFSFSNEFSLSTLFTKSKSFSNSFEFSPSSNFTYSLPFNLTKEFTHSIDFTQSINFTKSYDFSISNTFRYSDFFSFSNYFSNSAYFSETQTLIPKRTIQSNHNKKAIILGVSFAILGLIIIVTTVVLIFLFKKNKKNEIASEESIKIEPNEAPSNVPSYDSVDIDTNFWI